MEKSLLILMSAQGENKVERLKMFPLASGDKFNKKEKKIFLTLIVET